MKMQVYYTICVRQMSTKFLLRSHRCCSRYKTNRLYIDRKKKKQCAIIKTKSKSMIIFCCFSLFHYTDQPLYCNIQYNIIIMLSGFFFFLITYLKEPSVHLTQNIRYFLRQNNSLFFCSRSEFFCATVLSYPIYIQLHNNTMYYTVVYAKQYSIYSANSHPQPNTIVTSNNSTIAAPEIDKIIQSVIQFDL